MNKRVIGVFTGNRAEYGLQYPILKAIDEHPELEYRLIVSGAHLDNNFGKTLEEIEKDGFTIHAEVKIDMDEDDLYSTANAIGSGIISLSKELRKINPDIFVVYADRFEGFAAVITGSQMNIPVAHIEGGDITEGGALDDSVRHAMSKLSHIHFTTNQQASNRILGMGEESWRVHTVGFPAIDLISQNNYATAKEIEEKYCINTSKPIVLFTQHSVTTEFDRAAEQVKPSLQALCELSEKKDYEIVITYPNNDAGGRTIIGEINKYKYSGMKIYQSLGRYFYHGVLALSLDGTKQVVCVGNSSSGIKETPAFGCPTVNIGSRQDSRLRGDNVIDADYNSSKISSAIKYCIENEVFRSKSKEGHNPYGEGNAGLKIANRLATIDLGPDILRKKMTLLGKKEGDWFS
jgi:UDP-hydrolysing UDP-N-acetyl-D-glucosamine 2-epimerase